MMINARMYDTDVMEGPANPETCITRPLLGSVFAAGITYLYPFMSHSVPF